MDAQVPFSVDDNIFTEITPDRFNCNICGISHVHKNDLQNHIKSRGHERKLLEKNEENKKNENKDEEKRFHCDVCNKNLTGEKFFEAHKGTKAHKRNLRKLPAKSQPEPHPVAPFSQVNRGSRKSRRISIADHKDEKLNAQFTREKYKIYPMNNDLESLPYKTYIYSLSGYFSLRLALDPTVTDFKISVNDKNWEPFGNIVVRLICNGKKTVYAIKCKTVTQARQISSLQEAKVNIDRQYNGIAQIRQAGMDIENTRFVILSTCGIGPNFNHSVTLKSTILNKWRTSNENILLDSVLKVRTKRNEIINVTSDRDNVYAITLSEPLNCQLPKLFFFANQRIFPSAINNLLKSRFDRCPDISTEYMKYIGNWIEGHVGGNYKLTKRDVVLKIGEILLKPYTRSPKRVQSKHDAFPIWNQVINQVDLTILKAEPYIISKVCQPLNLIIEETLSTTIDTITKTVNLKTTLNSVQEPIKSYVFEVTQEPLKDDIPLDLIYKVFWKAGRIPLLLSSEEDEEAKGFILDVILFMKQMGVHNKFMIKSADSNLNRFKEHLKIFTCLEDIKTMIDFNEVKIFVSDSFKLSLSDIIHTDPFFSKWVTPNIFFDISIRRYSFKPNYSLENIHNKKNVLKIILNDDVKDQLKHELYAKKDLSETDGYYSPNRLRGIEPNIL